MTFYWQIWLCIVKQFFIDIVANSTIIPDNTSLAQTWTAPYILCSLFCRNEFYEQNIPHCKLLILIIYQLSLSSDNLRHCWCIEEHDQLAFCPNYTHYFLKTQSTFFDHTFLWSKRKLTITTSINYYYLKTLILRNKPYKEK